MNTEETSIEKKRWIFLLVPRKIRLMKLKDVFVKRIDEELSKQGKSILNTIHSIYYQQKYERNYKKTLHKQLK